MARHVHAAGRSTPLMVALSFPIRLWRSSHLKYEMWNQRATTARSATIVPTTERALGRDHQEPRDLSRARWDDHPDARCRGEEWIVDLPHVGRASALVSARRPPLFFQFRENFCKTCGLEVGENAAGSLFSLFPRLPRSDHLVEVGGGALERHASKRTAQSIVRLPLRLMIRENMSPEMINGSDETSEPLTGGTGYNHRCGWSIP